MSSFVNVDDLRERNKHLLRKLRHQGEVLQSLISRPASDTVRLTEAFNEKVLLDHQRFGMSDTGGKKTTAVTCSVTHGTYKVRTAPDDSVVTLEVGHQSLARAALGRPKTHEIVQSPLAMQSSEQGNGKISTLDQYNTLWGQVRQPAESANSGHLLDKSNSCLTQLRKLEPTKPIAQNLDREQRHEQRRTVHPLLGYDWIAGLLDAESSLTDHSEQFLTELRNFRLVNREECIHSPCTGANEDDLPSPAHSSDEKDVEHAQQAHKCLFRYRINSRLFPTPLDSEAACPLCKTPKAQRTHTMADPAFIRISIPRSTLLPAYRYQAHQRNNFDQSDGLGLPSHCLWGWSGSVPSAANRLSSLDLRSSLEKELSDGSLVTRLNKRMDTSVSRVGGSVLSDRLLDVSRLARYHFPKLTPHGYNTRSDAYPIY